MTIIARIRPSVNVKPTRNTPIKPVPFGAGIFTPIESDRDRQFRYAMDLCDAVAECRAVRVPIGSPHYASFAAAMNRLDAKIRFGGFAPPTDADEAWLVERNARDEFEARVDMVERCASTDGFEGIDDHRGYLGDMVSVARNYDGCAE